MLFDNLKCLVVCKTLFAERGIKIMYKLCHCLLQVHALRQYFIQEPQALFYLNLCH